MAGSSTQVQPSCRRSLRESDAFPFAATGKPITRVSIGDVKDVDIAVKAAEEAFKTSWGLKVPAADRGKLLFKLADLVEKHVDELCALEALNAGELQLSVTPPSAF